MVNDEPAVLQLLKAGGGRQAVEVYRREQGRVALVLCHVIPGGMDGPATLAALRGISPQVRCCFMSANAGEYSAEQQLRMGAACVFAKSFGSLAPFRQARSRVLDYSASDAAGVRGSGGGTEAPPALMIPTNRSPSSPTQASVGLLAAVMNC